MVFDSEEDTTDQSSPSSCQGVTEKDESDETTVDLARVMFDTAILRSGYTLPDSSSFAGRIERMLRLSV